MKKSETKKSETILETILDQACAKLRPRKCETCGDNIAGKQVEYHTERHHGREPTRQELLLEVRESDKIIGALLARLTKAAGVAALVLSLSCASARPLPVASAPLLPSQVPACAMQTDGGGWVPSPCRLEVAPGEWLVMRSVQDPPKEKKRRWWVTALALLLI